MFKIKKISFSNPEIIVIVLAVALIASWGVIIKSNLKLQSLAKLNSDSSLNSETSNKVDPQLAKEYEQLSAQLFPEKGFEVPVKLGDSVPKLVEAGVIDVDKFKSLYDQRGGISEEDLAVFTKPSDKNLTINFENSNFLLNILWALGIANKNPILDSGPMMTEYKNDLGNFASTGGWTLGKEKNGAAYFSKFEIIKLTPEQQKIADYVASNTYRPCCGNSTAFPDCNHGVALLGLIELAASQGLSQKEIFDIALKFNSFWFPQNYLETALYFKLNKNTGWEKVNPEEILGYNYSSIQGWTQNVKPEIDKVRASLPKQGGGGSCGV